MDGRHRSSERYRIRLTGPLALHPPPTVGSRETIDPEAGGDAGYGVAMVEYRGFGGNPGTPTEAGLMMAFTTLSVMPVVLLFFVAQKYFIEGVTLSGLGGR